MWGCNDGGQKRSKLSSVPNQPRRRKAPFSSRTRRLTLRTLENSEPSRWCSLGTDNPVSKEGKSHAHNVHFTQKPPKVAAWPKWQVRGLETAPTFRPSSGAAAWVVLLYCTRGSERKRCRQAHFCFIASVLRNGICQLCSHESPFLTNPTFSSS